MSHYTLGATSTDSLIPPPPPETRALPVAPTGFTYPVTVTVGIPGFNASVPLTTRKRMWLALGLAVVVGVAGGIGIAKLIKKAQA